MSGLTSHLHTSWKETVTSLDFVIPISLKTDGVTEFLV